MGEKNIKDIIVNYLGVAITVSHSLYKPLKNEPGRIHYTFHLPSKSITIEQLINSNNEFYWSEVGKGKTEFASELGKALENFDID